MKLTAKVIVLLALCMALTACGFHFRNNKRLPTQFHTLYYTSKHPNSNVALSLQRLLESMDIHLVDSPSKARYSLSVDDDQLSTSSPALINSSLPTTITTALTVSLSIKNNRTHRVVTSNTFSASQDLLLSANQIYMPHTNNVLKQTLNQRIQINIFYWLTSKDMQKLLNHANHV